MQWQITVEQIREAVEVKLGEELSDSEIENLLSTVRSVSLLSEMSSEKLSLYTSYLVGIFLKEKYR